MLWWIGRAAHLPPAVGSSGVGGGGGPVDATAADELLYAASREAMAREALGASENSRERASWEEECRQVAWHLFTAFPRPFAVLCSAFSLPFLDLSLPFSLPLHAGISLR